MPLLQYVYISEFKGLYLKNDGLEGENKYCCYS